MRFWWYCLCCYILLLVCAHTSYSYHLPVAFILRVKSTPSSLPWRILQGAKNKHMPTTGCWHCFQISKINDTQKLRESFPVHLSFLFFAFCLIFLRFNWYSYVLTDILTFSLIFLRFCQIRLTSTKWHQRWWHLWRNWPAGYDSRSATQVCLPWNLQRRGCLSKLDEPQLHSCVCEVIQPTSLCQVLHFPLAW